MPADLTTWPAWQTLVASNPKYKKLWEEDRFPPALCRKLSPEEMIQRKLEREQRDRRLRHYVGWHMEQITKSLRLKPHSKCTCKSLAARMNRLGPEGCRRERASLVEDLKKNAKKYTWGDVAKAVAMTTKNAVASAVHLERPWIPNPLDPYGSMLDEAIGRAESAQREDAITSGESTGSQGSVGIPTTQIPT